MGRKATVHGELRISVTDLPETLAEMRRLMAEILREQAEAEASAYVAARLIEIAAAFEVGQRPEVDL